MTLRCKPGDLAIVIETDDLCRPLLGRIVRCVQIHAWTPEPMWETDPVLYIGDMRVWANDACLRPIRPEATEPASVEVGMMV